MMPGLDGRECFLKLKEINPGLRALLSTAYGKEGRTQDVLDEGFAGFIQKPYMLTELAHAVSSILKE